MPIDTRRLTPHIYTSDWSGEVNADDVLAGTVVRLASENAEIPYVIIIDASKLQTIAANVMQILQGGVIYGDSLGILVIQPPLPDRVKAELVGRLTGLNFEFFDDCETALARGRELAAPYTGDQGAGSASAAGIDLAQ